MDDTDDLCNTTSLSPSLFYTVPALIPSIPYTSTVLGLLLQFDMLDSSSFSLILNS